MSTAADLNCSEEVVVDPKQMLADAAQVQTVHTPLFAGHEPDLVFVRQCLAGFGYVSHRDTLRVAVRLVCIAKVEMHVVLLARGH